MHRSKNVVYSMTRIGAGEHRARCHPGPTLPCTTVRLGLNVQGYVADDPSETAERDRYRTIVCDGCGRSHLVNPITGKTPLDGRDE